MTTTIVELPPSKSELNRLLTLCKLYGGKMPSIGEQYPDDVKLLYKNLANTRRETCYCDNAGTVARFLTALMATDDNISLPKIVTGSDRLLLRPISNLVDALCTLGANIEYIDKPCHLPIKIISGTDKNQNCITFEKPESSQFVSAMMMIAPKFTNGLTINIKAIPSFTYVEMTSRMMNKIGLKNHLHDDKIVVEKEPDIVDFDAFMVEKDWSSAVYVYPCVFIDKVNEILLRSLHKGSMQGDEVICRIMEQVGITSRDTPAGIVIGANAQTQICKKTVEVDVRNTPDIMPALATISILSGCDFVIHGLENLKYKESNRVKGITENFDILGTDYRLVGDNTLYINALGAINKIKTLSHRCELKTMHDHRMAMALHYLSYLNNNIVIDDYRCISKSFPDFLSQVASHISGNKLWSV